MGLDDMVKSVSDSATKLIDDVKKRASTIIESAVNLAIENGKKRLEDLRKILQEEHAKLEAKKAEVVKEIKTAVETEQHNFSALTKKFEQEIKDDLLNTKKEFLADVQNERSAISHEVELIKAELKIELHKELLDKLEARIKEVGQSNIFTRLFGKK